MSEEAELLRRYPDERSEAAFEEVVRRNLNLVHSAAIRQVGGNPAAAADIAQAVFTELACQANRFSFFIIKSIRGSGRVLSLEFRAVGQGVSVPIGRRVGVER